MEQNKMN